MAPGWGITWPLTKEFGETVWVENPSAVIQFLVWTEHGVDEALVGYDGENITAHVGHEESDSSESYQRLRAEIDGTAEDSESDPEQT